jgi:hypothetical protein
LPKTIIDTNQKPYPQKAQKVQKAQNPYPQKAQKPYPQKPESTSLILLGIFAIELGIFVCGLVFAAGWDVGVRFGARCRVLD